MKLIYVTCIFNKSEPILTISHLITFLLTRDKHFDAEITTQVFIQKFNIISYLMPHKILLALKHSAIFDKFYNFLDIQIILFYIPLSNIKTIVLTFYWIFLHDNEKDNNSKFWLVYFLTDWITLIIFIFVFFNGAIHGSLWFHYQIDTIINKQHINDRL